MDKKSHTNTAFINYLRYFLNKFSKKNYCLLLTTTSGVIKGTPQKFLEINDYHPLDFDTYLNDYSKFIEWYDFGLDEDKKSTTPDPKDKSDYINPQDIVILKNVTIYNSGQKFNLSSYIVFAHSITGISIIPQDYEPVV